MKSPPMYVGSLYFHYSPLQYLCVRCCSTHCNSWEKQKKVPKNMTYLKNMEIFDTKRGLKISAFLMNTVKPNYEINTVFYTYNLKIYYIY